MKMIIQVHGFDDGFFSRLVKELGSHEDKFASPHQVTLENVQLSTADRPLIRILRNDEQSVPALVRLIDQLPVIRYFEDSILDVEVDYANEGLPPDGPVASILQEDFRRNNLVVAVPLKAAA